MIAYNSSQITSAVLISLDHVFKNLFWKWCSYYNENHIFSSDFSLSVCMYGYGHVDAFDRKKATE